MTAEQLAKIWRNIIIGDQKTWSLFKNGTVVIFTNPPEDIRKESIAIMEKWGPVRAGGPAGDFSVINLTNTEGWAVACHHNDILTYVSEMEVKNKNSDMEIGLIGREKRHQDSQDLEIIHIEER